MTTTSGGSGNNGGCGTTCGNGLEKIYPTTVVRYGYLGFVGEFTHDPDLVFTCGGRVVVQTDRGIELGTQLSLTCNGCAKSVSREQMRRYVEASGPEYLRINAGRILREATPDDLREQQRLEADNPERMQRCRELIEKHQLDMRLVQCEPLLGGERIIFYFMAAGRVDFRALVRDLAREFQTRIELRQIGARDEARLLADYETCGRECCCRNFLKSLKPVSMKMAKMQKATLDPSKVSGRCGRLKCCLRYEHESYETLESRLPSIGRFVRTAHGDGEVIDRQVLTQLVTIRTRDDRILTVVIEDVDPRDLPPGASDAIQADMPFMGARRVRSDEPWEEPTLITPEMLARTAPRNGNGDPPAAPPADTPPTPRRRPARSRRRRGGKRRGRRHDA